MHYLTFQLVPRTSRKPVEDGVALAAERDTLEGGGEESAGPERIARARSERSSAIAAASK